jgi:transcriptional regulator with XRE-family HTH domain
MEHLHGIIEKLNEARVKRGMSSAELARRANMTAIALTSTFRHERSLQADELVRIGRALGVSLDRLLQIDDKTTHGG